MVSSGDGETVRHGSYKVGWVIAVVQRDPKDKDSKFESFVFGSFCTTLKPGFHMIARIASDARVAENSDLRSLRSLRLNGNCFKNLLRSLRSLRSLRFELEKILSLRFLRSLRQEIF